MKALDLTDIRFLTYDPNAHSRHLILNVLRAFKVQVSNEAITTTDAWASIDAAPPDVLMMNWWRDLEMEKKLVSLIRASENDKLRFMPVIAISASTSAQGVVAARNIGINEYLLKPFSPKSLYLRVASVISRPRNYVEVGDYFGPDRRRKQTLYDKDDRRGSGGETAFAPPDVVRVEKEDLTQDEINTLINPEHEQTNEEIELDSVE